MSADLLPEFAERRIDVHGSPVRYFEAGSGSPVVVLHGGGGVRILHTHSLLARHYRVLLLEQPGFGDATDYEAPASMETYAQQVRDHVNALVDSSYSLVGTSFGSRVAAWIAVREPGDVDALALLSPTIFLPDSFFLSIDGSGDPPPLYAHPERYSAAPLEPAVRARQLSLVGHFLQSEDADLEAALALLDTPTIVVFGTEDRIMPCSLGHKYVELNPQFFLSLVYDAGHVIEEERPEATAALLSDFIDHRSEYHVARESGLLLA